MYYFVEFLRAKGALRLALILLGIILLTAIVLRISVHGPTVDDWASNDRAFAYGPCHDPKPAGRIRPRNRRRSAEADARGDNAQRRIDTYGHSRADVASQ